MSVIQARVSDADERRYKAFAKRRGVSLSALMKTAIENEMRKEEGTLAFGIKQGKMWIAEDFDAPLPDVEAAFYGE
ncbi:MAG: hypothetical protein LBR00_01535 [Clostridiales Family XIII bacterium]|nr:hypothetical protein [Clostridiales Family XIII bacterium]